MPRKIALRESESTAPGCSRSAASLPARRTGLDPRAALGISSCVKPTASRRKAVLRSSLAPYALGALLAVSATAGDARANPRAPEVLKALEALREKRFEDALKTCAPGPQREIQPECPLIRAHALHALGK